MSLVQEAEAAIAMVLTQVEEIAVGDVRGVEQEVWSRGWVLDAGCWKYGCTISRRPTPRQLGGRGLVVRGKAPWAGTQHRS